MNIEQLVEYLVYTVGYYITEYYTLAMMIYTSIIRNV